MIRVQFAHGLEGSPQGAKSVFLREHFDAGIPAMDTSDFASCVAHQLRELMRFEPNVLVGSSFGGAVVLELLRRGDYSGPALLLAPAAGIYSVPLELPPNTAVTIVHGSHDHVVPLADSRQLATTGTPSLIRFIELDDNHALGSLVHTGQLGRLDSDLYELSRGSRPVSDR